ncbi:MAG: glucosamine--fructose-6-phosphate aminotransferase, isomerizing [Francisellaceae bacterium]|nr:glucosamine--fructose-6-phosphate aminotransferase, isomerizing [Francisellaceae bacterium]
MCGIIGAISNRNIIPNLIQGLKHLEYRGYDSAGIAFINNNGFERIRAKGKVRELAEVISNKKNPVNSTIGIAHTRWATHGEPNEQNAHPHIAKDRIVLVHNGIIENYHELKVSLQTKGYEFESETDSEVVAYSIYDNLIKEQDLKKAIRQTISVLKGAYALCVMDINNPDFLYAIRKGSPVIIGIGSNEHFVASDILALQGVCNQFLYLEEGDCAEISTQKIEITDEKNLAVKRAIHQKQFALGSTDKGQYRHYMLKEIYEQPTAIRETLEGRLHDNKVFDQAFGVQAATIFDKAQIIQIIGCGTSYHAGLLARFWIEELTTLPCHVEVASEFRYRHKNVQPNTLLVCISQSGETADTLAALRSTLNNDNYCGRLAICNVAESSLMRESELKLLMAAGPEIGVCSTKAFTAQLVSLLLLSLTLGKRTKNNINLFEEIIHGLVHLPNIIEKTLGVADGMQHLAQGFIHKNHSLFLGRGIHYPVALEGALKLKEISYIHAEAYPAGELKHGPLALVDSEMPIVVIAPPNFLLEKLKSNIQEVKARGGELIVFTSASANMKSERNIKIIEVPEVIDILAPIVYNIPLQLLAYYVAVLKGTDVDQPRNLAKSVTVE